jgi:hypothetical protein
MSPQTPDHPYVHPHEAPPTHEDTEEEHATEVSAQEAHGQSSASPMDSALALASTAQVHKYNADDDDDEDPELASLAISKPSTGDEKGANPAAHLPLLERPVTPTRLSKETDTLLPGMGLKKSDAQSEPEHVVVAEHDGSIFRIDGEPASGSYIFVVKREKAGFGTLHMVEKQELVETHSNPKPVGHAGLAEAIGATDDDGAPEVAWAGSVSFVGGHAVLWTNDSGHFAPPAVKGGRSSGSSASGAEEKSPAADQFWGLPLSSFRDYSTLLGRDLPDSDSLATGTKLMGLLPQIREVAEATRGSLKQDPSGSAKAMGAWAGLVHQNIKGSLGDISKTQATKALAKMLPLLQKPDATIAGALFSF